LDEFGLGIISAAVVFEPRKNQRTISLSKSSRKIKTVCEEIYDKLKQKELRYRIYPINKLPYFHLSNSMEAWLRGTNFTKTLQLTDTDEGEVVRYFRMYTGLKGNK
jgi:superfamily II RNA helicase